MLERKKRIMFPSATETNTEDGAVKKSKIKQIERSLGSLPKQSVMPTVRKGGQAPRRHNLKSQIQ